MTASLKTHAWELMALALFYFVFLGGEYFWLFGGFCGRDSGIGPAQRAKTTIWN